MRFPTIKYIKMTCPECQKEYEVNLKARDAQIMCYKCMIPLDPPQFFEETDIEATNAAIASANIFLDLLYKRSVDVTFDGDGFSVKQLSFATTPPRRTIP